MATRSLINRREPVKWPQFRLRTLMFAVALLAVLFAVMGLIGPTASAGLVMILVLAGLHVIGNALGTSLRDTANQHVANDPPANRAAARENADSGR